jgi:hypothetical protein
MITAVSGRIRPRQTPGRGTRPISPTEDPSDEEPPAQRALQGLPGVPASRRASLSQANPAIGSAGSGTEFELSQCAASYSAMMFPGMRPRSLILWPRCRAHSLISELRSRPGPARPLRRRLAAVVLRA